MYSSSPSVANVENTPVKIIPIKKLSFDFNASDTNSTVQERTNNTREVIEETPVKEDENPNDILPSDMMAREIQRLSVRLRSATPCKIITQERSTISTAFCFLSQCTMFPLLTINRVNQLLYIFLK